MALDAALARVPDCALDVRRALARGATCTMRAFAEARAAYKREEALVELLAPAAAAALNGRRQEVDDDDESPPGTSASAFAALEAALPELSASKHEVRADRRAANPRAVTAAVDAGRTAVRTLLAQSGDFRVSAPLAFEAAHLEVARVATLGVTGFDTPETRAGVAESAVALRGAAALVAALTAPAPARARALAALERAARHAEARPDFARFNRVTFIAAYTEPALRALEAARVASGVPRVLRPRAWVGTTLFARRVRPARLRARVCPDAHADPRRPRRAPVRRPRALR